MAPQVAIGCAQRMRFLRHADTPSYLHQMSATGANIRRMSTPTVEAAINDLMDRAWNSVYKLLADRGLLGDAFDVDEYTGLMSWMEGPVRYTVVHSPTVAVLFQDTDPVDAIVFHRDLLGSDDPKAFFAVA